jgi:regulator of cell morphogenesis and NO signaling
MNIKTENTLSQIVTQNLKAAEILESHNIDFCCGGDKTLGEACQEQNIAVDTLKKELEEAKEGADSESTMIKNMNASELSEYIVKRHHSYVRESIPKLKNYLEKIWEVHGKNHPELFKVKEDFSKASEALTDHMNNEEQVLFPVIHEMVKAKNENTKINAPWFGILENPINQMKEEHLNEGERFDNLAEITDNFKVPEDGCNTYVLTYNQLSEFVSDLHKHIHLENNIIFPEAIKLEKETIEK